MKYRALGRTEIQVSPWIIAAVEHSLRRLHTDHLDLYQVHCPDPTVDVEETLSALSDLIHSGKVRAIGSSTFPASEIVEAQCVAQRRGLERFRTEQPPYSIINRSIEREVLPICQRYGMGTLVWSPLGQGLLTGRYRKGKQADTHRSGGMPQHFDDERKLEVVEQLIPLADKAGLRMTHLAMAFAIAHPGVTSAIIGPRTANSSTTCWPAVTSPSTTKSSTRSMRSLRPIPTPDPTMWPTRHRRSRSQACVADPPRNAPPPDRRVGPVDWGVVDGRIRVCQIPWGKRRQFAGGTAVQQRKLGQSRSGKGQQWTSTRRCTPPG
ncbi:aldo/keto reductase [Mycobacterium shimoidei]|uniref:Aldo/keto reductase [Verrucosispora maris AB-18-032] n=1 Tax=Mycobacterium shimoidei TaxID=29313 RepID=A0A375Z1B7_MYCSH|nr:aldo/keto reductase [Mycobacterium shimoidei]SRX94750.1 aldo/keto reductase [Verrucosispora maris AB-18-032] [Mycobacterium shimoidei]